MALSGKENKDLRHNYIVNILDGAFFGFGIGFASFSTVLPLFFSTLTNSALLIGLIPAIHNTGVMLPQLFTARSLNKVRFFKPPLMRATIHERLPFLGLALISWFLPVIGKPLALVLGFGCLVWQGLGAGFTGNAWQNMLGRVIPSDFLATFFGLQSAAANLLASGGAMAAGFLLERLDSPLDFTSLFVICFSLMMVSYVSVNLTREPERQLADLPQAKMSLSKSILTILRKDPPFRWFLVTRNLFQFGTMAFAFYTVYAVRHHGMNEITAGVMTSVLMVTATIANPLLGWLADRWGRRRVFIAGAISGSLSAFLAFLLPDLNFFFLVFVLSAFASTTFWTIGMAYTLDFGTEAERPTYVGMANTLIAPSAILAPLFGGWVADNLGYPATFLIASICGILTVLVLRFFVTEKYAQKSVQPVESSSVS
jgi:MFS family permease